MPKKFNEQEREWIRRKLLEYGRRSFETIGLKKTSVEELTKAAGIAQGSFYMFFGSKEELFYEILQEEERSIRGKLLQSLESESVVTKEGIRRFLLDAFRLIERSPLMRHTLLEGEMEQLIRKLPKELLERNFSEDRHALNPVIQKWQDAGILEGVRPELITSLLRSVMLLSLHKKEIGEPLFQGTMELLIDILAEGIYVKKEREA